MKNIWLRIKILFGVKLISLDFDGVGWELDKVMSTMVKEDYGVNYKTTDVTHWAYFYEKYPKSTRCWYDWELYKEAGFIDGFLDFLEELKSIYGAKSIQFVTSSPESIQTEKTKMMLNLLGIDVIHVTKDKKSVYTKGTILIDDASHNIIDHLENTRKHGILFDLNGEYGWNQDFYECERTTRATNYKEVLLCLAQKI